MRALAVASIVSALLGFLVVDAPEFIQQYRQCLVGHIGELQIFLRDFDEDASRAHLDREVALRKMESGAEQFFKERARRIRTFSEKLRNLERQEVSLRYVSPLSVVNFYRTYDREIYDEARRNYKWGLNIQGIQLAIVFSMLCFALILPLLLFFTRSVART